MISPRGSYWRKFCFCGHNPYSALGHSFGDDFDSYASELFKMTIAKRINVIGITDYFIVDGYKRVKQDILEGKMKAFDNRKVKYRLEI